MAGLARMYCRTSGHSGMSCNLFIKLRSVPPYPVVRQYYTEHNFMGLLPEDVAHRCCRWVICDMDGQQLSRSEFYDCQHIETLAIAPPESGSGRGETKIGPCLFVIGVCPFSQCFVPCAHHPAMGDEGKSCSAGTPCISTNQPKVTMGNNHTGIRVY